MKIHRVPEHKNPMLNHVVLERIFKIAEFDIKSFATYRLVCKQWYETSLPTWRKNAWLPVTTTRKQHGVYFEDYLQLLNSQEQRLTAVPFRKYKIRSWDGFIHRKGEKKLERLEFWKTVGPLMTHLHLKSNHFYFNDDFRQVIYRLTPNLKSLVLGKNEYYRPDRRVYVIDDFEPQEMGLKVCQHLTELKVNLVEFENFPNLCIELPWHFPNIEIFEATQKVPSCATENLCGLFGFVDELRNTESSHCFKNLSELRLLDKKRRNTLTQELALRLQRLQFPLKVLTLDVGSEEDSGDAKDTLKIVLETHAQTLEELILVREEESVPYEDFPFGIEFPKLTKIRSTGKLVKDFKFVQHMPNLEYLHLEQEGHGIHLSNIGWSNSIVNPNLKEFKITERFCGQNEIKFLGEVMPNLTKITLGLKNERCFKSICQIWKEVTDVTIYSGASVEDVYWKSEVGDKYVKESIVDLKELRCLKLGKFIKYPE
ncbi:unnamed protein product [Orchesella dallaii]|uniref:F-box domain-containing protein n=1 Tax=Orchesella dallaii TaxID=48710 RepID=A0ABP1S9V8_9HEXA